jgi:hypothetical protein
MIASDKDRTLASVIFGLTIAVAARELQVEVAPVYPPPG